MEKNNNNNNEIKKFGKFNENKRVNDRQNK